MTLALAVLVASAAILVAAFVVWRHARLIRSLETLVARITAGEEAPPSRGVATRLARAIRGLDLEQRRRVRELERERDERERILAHLDAGVGLLDDAGRLVRANHALADLLGRPVGAAIGRPLVELVRTPGFEELVRRCRTERRTIETELRLWTPLERTIRATATPLGDSTGTGVVLVLHDLTEAERLDRVRQDFVANVSHELRTPLNIILGYAALLGETLPPGGAPDAGDMLGKVRTQAERLLQLVESLLALNRLNAGSESVRVSRFTLAELIEELRGSAVTLNAERQLTVAWNVASEPCEVDNDREKVRAIAYHLVSNAIKFTAVGQVEVEAATTPDGGIVLTVSDTGIGLSPEAKSVVFDDFRQLDGSSTRRYEGLGIGLGIVKRYTALLGGTVGLESTPGKGTTIVVRLPPPLKRASAADSTGASRGPAPTPTWRTARSRPA